MSKLNLKTELRHLNPQERRKIENLLNAADSWQELINILPKELESLDNNNEQQKKDSELLINNDKYNLLKGQKDVKNSSPSKALLDYWSTYGKRRPTIEHLIYYSAKCKLNRLVDCIISDLLENSIDELKPKTKLLVSTDNFKFEDEQIESIENHQYETQNELNQLNIRTIDFNLIKKYTNNFDDKKLKDNGNKIGEGGFGKVYLARIPKDEFNLECELDFKNENYLIAVKLVSNEFKNQYFNELKFLNNFKHQNLLNLIGLSYFKNDLCILSEYMINGSLQDCLLPSNFRPLNYEQRIKNIEQIIDAICYLHTFEEGKPLIHRDIKSSNILLDRNFNCKLCDFGLARLGTLNSTTNYTINIIGTSVYMAPESFKGRITVKIDTFSFGIVLFEILTGLPPITTTNQQQINNNEDDNEFTDILSYLNENLFGELEESELNEDNTYYIEYIENIEQYLDKKAGKWNIEKAIKLFDLARKATNDKFKKRPTMVEIKQEFEKNFR